LESQYIRGQAEGIDLPSTNNKLKLMTTVVERKLQVQSARDTLTI